MIVATDRKIFYKMLQAAAGKELIIAPTAGEGASCRSYARCPWMNLNQLEATSTVFEQHDNEIFVTHELIEKALKPLTRMVEFIQ